MTVDIVRASASAGPVQPPAHQSGRLRQSAPRQIAGSPGSTALDPDAGYLNSDPRKHKRTSAESRIGKVPTYGLPAANGASDSGYDSPTASAGQGNIIRARPSRRAGRAGHAAAQKPPLNAVGQLRLSIPPSETANKQPLPPAMAGAVPGQPQRRRMKIETIHSARSAITSAASWSSRRSRSPAATTPIPAAFSRAACRSGWSRRNSSR